MPKQSEDDDDNPKGELGLAHREETDTGGDPACWAHLVCSVCGAVTSEGHIPGCELTLLGRDEHPSS